MDPIKIIERIEPGNPYLIYWVVGILVFQFLAIYVFGERLKNSIMTQYNKSLESYKDELLRKKIIFEEQLLAYKKFSSIKYEIYPEKSHPDMDWGEAVQQIAMGFSGHYRLIKEFQIEYSAILPDSLRNKVEHCSYMCTDGGFEVSSDHVSDQGYKFADELWDKMQSIDKEFRILLKINSNSETNKTKSG